MTCSHSIQPRCVQLSMPGALSRCDLTRGRVPHPTRAIFLLGPSKSSCNSAPDIGRCPRTGEVGERREPVSSASASSDGGIVNPSALAVLRLITSSNLVGSSTGSEFPRIDISGRLLGQDEIDAVIQTTFTSRMRRVDFGGCGPGAGAIHLSVQGVESRVMFPLRTSEYVSVWLCRVRRGAIAS